MRMFTAAAGAALLILAASPALAHEPRGGGGGYPQRPSPCCRGGDANVNVNVDARAHASVYASSRSYVSARPYDLEPRRGGSSDGRVVYVGGGYNDYPGYGGAYVSGPIYYGAPIYNARVLDGPACPSAPFGYVVTGFGRDTGRASWCGYRREDDRDRRHDRDRDRDRGGRYGYSDRHDDYAERRYESRETYEEYEAAVYYEEREDYRDDGRRYERRDCDCREPAPYQSHYAPEPPRYDPPPPPRPYAPEPPRYEPPVYESPTARPYYSEPPPPPRQRYSQEPGERG